MAVEGGALSASCTRTTLNIHRRRDAQVASDPHSPQQPLSWTKCRCSHCREMAICARAPEGVGQPDLFRGLLQAQAPSTRQAEQDHPPAAVDGRAARTIGDETDRLKRRSCWSIASSLSRRVSVARSRGGGATEGCDGQGDIEEAHRRFVLLNARPWKTRGISTFS